MLARLQGKPLSLDAYRDQRVAHLASGATRATIISKLVARDPSIREIGRLLEST